MSIDFTGITGVSDDYGVVTQIADESGRVLWSAVGWPDDLDTGLEFASASAFTLSVASPGWNGTMQYCNGCDWQTWDGREISSGETKSGHRIYVRGIGNSKVIGLSGSSWTLVGADIACNGNIGKTLDYATVKSGSYPETDGSCFEGMFQDCTSLTSAPSLPATTLSRNCYARMFQGCTSLTSAPSLPATTLSINCYFEMFRGCTSLTSIPSLPATTLESYCYDSMFYGCKKIKLSATKQDSYTKEYRIPHSGIGTGTNSMVSSMFYSTGGTFTGTPSINTTYYLDSSNSIV